MDILRGRKEKHKLCGEKKRDRDLCLPALHLRRLSGQEKHPDSLTQEPHLLPTDTKHSSFSAFSKGAFSKQRQNKRYSRTALFIL